jgi:tRNA(Ser,Leu) C12 N-acetylase TAN1
MSFLLSDLGERTLPKLQKRVRIRIDGEDYIFTVNGKDDSQHLTLEQARVEFARRIHHVLITFEKDRREIREILA